ncbi:MAG: hypothetical protein GEU75_13335 [Dehalococcoidia bacterium]|nr:hypothetical protein [Dehalococcoidia bacterium]
MVRVNRRTGFWRRWRQWRPSPAQRRVLDALIEGKSNAVIASELGISAETVKWHISELLAETGQEDRHDLAAWWESRRDQQQLILPGVFVGKKLSLAALALVGALILTAGWALWPGKGGDELPRQSESIGIDGLTQPSPAAAATESLFSQSLIELESEDRRLHIRDLQSGSRRASLNVGYAPMVLVRQNSQQLLVAELPPKPGSQGQLADPVLKVYDLADPNRVLRTIDLPNRPSCHGFCQPMVLSNDQRYLYYDSVRNICPSGGDASVCDSHAVSIVDMDNPTAAAIDVPLPVGCGIPALAPAVLTTSWQRVAPSIPQISAGWR